MIRFLVIISVALGLTTATALPSLAQELKATIAGTVTDTGGRPVPQYVIQWTSADDKRLIGSAVTDAAGSYTIENLADGTYLVGFFPPSAVPEQAKAALEQRSDVSPELASIGPPFSRRVTIRGGNSLKGVDFIIVPQTGFPKIISPEVDGSTFGLPATGSPLSFRTPESQTSVLWKIIALSGAAGLTAAGLTLAAGRLFLRLRS